MIKNKIDKIIINSEKAYLTSIGKFKNELSELNPEIKLKMISEICNRTEKRLTMYPSRAYYEGTKEGIDYWEKGNFLNIKNYILYSKNYNWIDSKRIKEMQNKEWTGSINQRIIYDVCSIIKIEYKNEIEEISVRIEIEDLKNLWKRSKSNFENAKELYLKFWDEKLEELEYLEIENKYNVSQYNIKEEKNVITEKEWNKINIILNKKIKEIFNLDIKDYEEEIRRKEITNKMWNLEKWSINNLLRIWEEMSKENKKLNKRLYEKYAWITFKEIDISKNYKFTTSGIIEENHSLLNWNKDLWFKTKEYKQWEKYKEIIEGIRDIIKNKKINEETWNKYFKNRIYEIDWWSRKKITKEEIEDNKKWKLILEIIKWLKWGKKDLKNYLRIEKNKIPIIRHIKIKEIKESYLELLEAQRFLNTSDSQSKLEEKLEKDVIPNEKRQRNVFKEISWGKKKGERVKEIIEEEEEEEEERERLIEWKNKKGGWWQEEKEEIENVRWTEENALINKLKTEKWYGIKIYLEKRKKLEKIIKKIIIHPVIKIGENKLETEIWTQIYLIGMENKYWKDKRKEELIKWKNDKKNNKKLKERLLIEIEELKLKIKKEINLELKSKVNKSNRTNNKVKLELESSKKYIRDWNKKINNKEEIKENKDKEKVKKDYIYYLFNAEPIDAYKLKEKEPKLESIEKYISWKRTNKLEKETNKIVGEYKRKLEEKLEELKEINKKENEELNRIIKWQEEEDLKKSQYKRLKLGLKMRKNNYKQINKERKIKIRK